MTATPEAQVDLEDWKRFADLADMSDHWRRPEWGPSRRMITWYALFDDSRLTRYVRLVQAHLAEFPFLDPIPSDGLHMTVQAIGFGDELPAGAAERLARDSHEVVSFPSFDLTVGPVNAYPGGVFLRASPWSPVIDLQRRLRRPAEQLLGRELPEQTGGFRPHISVAYCHDTVPAADLVERVAELREWMRPITVTVKEICLLSVYRKDHTYRWDEMHRERLAGSDPS